jgi:hypothetical protein
MKKGMVAILLLWLVAYIYVANRPRKILVQRPVPAPVAEPVEQSAPEPEPEPSQEAAPAAVVQPAPAPRPRVVREKSGKKLALRYKIINNMYIVQGDIVAGGVVPGENPPEDGRVEMDPLRLWPNVIPYHIQPDVPNKERILEALKMFEGTAVQFVPENGETDVLVFEQGEKHCWSYLGKASGKQPIWISPLCSSSDIAHEIMHALGFVHEQNRSDRDNYIDVHPENIEDEYVFNFEKLPQEYMRVSGSLEFDYQSLMMYPPWMFAKGGRNTMEPKQRDKLIDPQPRLSTGDIERLNRAYRR